MSGEHKQRPRPASDTAEETPDPGQPDEDSVARAAEASAKAAAVLNDIDYAEIAHESLVTSLFEPGEVITPDELDKRAEIANKNYTQKGGQ